MNESMHAVDVVLATYNGEPYLDEFLESMVAQTHTNWRLLVSDDGSSDGTLAVVARWAARDPRIRLVNIERQGGVAANFSKATEFATADYVLLADQDDVWLPAKISTMLGVIIETENGDRDVPILCFSDLTLVDQGLQPISPSLYGYRSLDPMRNLDAGYLLWFSAVYGCSVIVNQALVRRSIPVPSSAIMHDQWFALQAAMHGRVVYLNQSFVLYRQHGNNDMGALRSGLLHKARRFGWYHRRISARAARVRQEIAHLVQHDADRVALERKGVSLNPGLMGRVNFVRRHVLPYARGQAAFALAFAVAFLVCPGPAMTKSP